MSFGYVDRLHSIVPTRKLTFPLTDIPMQDSYYQKSADSLVYIQYGDTKPLVIIHQQFQHNWNGSKQTRAHWASFSEVADFSTVPCL